MSNNVIAVWGNDGAGKSLISCALAHRIATDNTPVVIISTNKQTPMFKVYLPMTEEKPGYSIGKLLTGGISLSVLADIIHTHPDNDNVGFMSLVRGDNALVYQGDWSMAALNQLLDLLLQEALASYIIFDCCSDVFSDKGTLFALERAAAVVRVASPDNRSVAFWEAQAPILHGGNFHEEQHLMVLNNVYDYSPVKQMVKDWGYEYAVPHSPDAYRRFVAGKALCKLQDAAGYAFDRILAKLATRVVERCG